MPSRKSQKQVIARVVVQRKNGRGKRPRYQKLAQVARMRRLAGGQDVELARAYSNTLNDPFECEGVRLGWGCLVPSTIATAYLRQTITSNADGSIGLMALPNSANILYQNIAGAAVATWTANNATDNAACNNNFGTGRCISIGMKAFPSIAATAAPGASFAGAITGLTVTQLLALTPNDLEALPMTQMGIGTNGATATGRPIDPTSFQFTAHTVNANGILAAETPSFSVPYICFEGLPASSPVVVEVVMNFEGLALMTHLAAGLGEGETSSNVLSSTWASIEQLWNHIKPDLIQVAKNTVSSAAALGANTLGNFASRQLAMPMNRQLRVRGS